MMLLSIKKKALCCAGVKKSVLGCSRLTSAQARIAVAVLHRAASRSEARPQKVSNVVFDELNGSNVPEHKMFLAHFI